MLRGDRRRGVNVYKTSSVADRSYMKPPSNSSLNTRLQAYVHQRAPAIGSLRFFRVSSSSSWPLLPRKPALPEPCDAGRQVMTRKDAVKSCRYVTCECRDDRASRGEARDDTTDKIRQVKIRNMKNYVTRQDETR